MKIITIPLKRVLEVTMNEFLKRKNELDGQNEKALTEEYKDWIEACGRIKDQPHVLYANQVVIEQL